MGFHPFKAKRRPPRPMKFWKAVVTHHIEPDVLRPGEKARHKVVVKNIDLARHEYTVKAQTQGTLLAYGSEGTWAPPTIIADGGGSIDPAAIIEFELPKNTSPAHLPAIEQIDIAVTGLVKVRDEIVEKKRVYTLLLDKP